MHRPALLALVSVLAATLVAVACGDDSASPDAGDIDAGRTGDGGDSGGGDGSTSGSGGMFIAVDDEAPVQVYAMGVDSETYTEIVERLDAAPNGLEDTGPRAVPTEREITPWFPPSAIQTIFVKTLALRERSRPTDGAGDLDITFGNGGGVAIGLLLPAVQKVREAASRPSSSRGAEVGHKVRGGADWLDTTWLEGTAEPEGPTLRIEGSVEAASPALSSATASRLAPMLKARFEVDEPPRMSRNAEDALELSPLTARFDPALAGALDTWRAVDGEMAVVIDVVDDAGQVHYRMRLPRVPPPTASGDRVVLEPTPGVFLKQLALAAHSFPTHPIDVAETHYSDYSAVPFMLAQRTLTSLPTLDDAAPSRTVPAFRDYWLGAAAPGQRDAVIASLRDAVVLAASYEGMLIMLTLPLASRAGKALQDAMETGALSPTRDRHRLVAALAEATFEMGEPARYAFVGGNLEVTALGAPPADADAETGLHALLQLEAMQDADPEAAALVSATDWRLIGQAAAAARRDSGEAYLDYLTITLTGVLDGIAEGTVVDVAAAIREANALLTLLDAALTQQTATTQAIVDFKDVLIASYSM